MKIVKRMILALSLTAVALVLGADAGKKAVVARILNNYSQAISFQNSMIKPGAQKAVVYPVPFVSYERYESAFILGKPFVPDSALKLVIDGRVFRIWRTEEGVTGAWELTSDVEYKDAVPKRLVADKTCSLLPLVVAVNPKGLVTLTCAHS
jgi:hypothetical protein